jgi:bifunctional NMN adenylyltransferase/nudix hydrolase
MKISTDYKTTGIIVARFQVHELHVEHKALIEKVRQYHKKIFLFLGVAPVKTDKNPLDYPTRVKMVLSEYPDIIILPLQDVESDQVWAENLDKLIKIVEPKNKVLLYGGRDSFIKYYKPFGSFETVETLSTFDISGTEVRESISNEVLNTSDFRAGQIYQIYNRYPIVYPTVDIIITKNYYKTNNEPTEYLLGKKHAEINDDYWRLIGGFIEKRHGGGKNSIIAEVLEETNLDISKSIITFVNQYTIDDWRYRGSKDNIMTTLFHVDISSEWKDNVFSNTLCAGDDIAYLEWFKENEIKDVIRNTHKQMLLNFINKNYGINN